MIKKYREKKYPSEYYILKIVWIKPNRLGDIFIEFKKWK
jgi:hypothetical protein